MDELEYLRKCIDDIDKRLVKDFEERMKTVLKIAAYKKERNLPIFHKNREEEVIQKNLSYLEERNFEKATKEFLNHLMSISRQVQEEAMKNLNQEIICVGYQGVEGSFSEQAVDEYFKGSIIKKNVPNFEDVFEALKAKEIDYGVLPIENSSTGAIADVYDLLRQYGFYIVGEKCVKVEHHLLGIKGSKMKDIVEVYSHPQAFRQSSKFFKTHTGLKRISYENTAMSAKKIAQDQVKNKGCVASKKAAQLYDLEILHTQIQDHQKNHTRFIIIARDKQSIKKADKISMIVSTKHEAGKLYKALESFAKNGINMLKIESRPVIYEPWEYFFYIDLEGNLENDETLSAIQNIQQESSYFQLLGNYKRDRG